MGSSAISGGSRSPISLKPSKVSAVARVIDAAALMFEHETAVTAMMVAQRPRAPMFARRKRHLPVLVRETFPPFQFDDPFEAEVQREIADAPGHHADFRLRQPAQRRLVEMIEVRVRQQHEINRRQVLDFQTGALDAFEEEKPVRKVRIDQHVQVGELNQKRSVTDPGDGDLARASISETPAADVCRSGA